MYVQPETMLYTVADLSSVWVLAQVFQSDAGKIKPGDSAEVTVDAYPGRSLQRARGLHPSSVRHEHAHAAREAGVPESGPEVETWNVRECSRQAADGPPAWWFRPAQLFIPELGIWFLSTAAKAALSRGKWSWGLKLAMTWWSRKASRPENKLLRPQIS